LALALALFSQGDEKKKKDVRSISVRIFKKIQIMVLRYHFALISLMLELFRSVGGFVLKKHHSSQFERAINFVKSIKSSSKSFLPQSTCARALHNTLRWQRHRQLSGLRADLAGSIPSCLLGASGAVQMNCRWWVSQHSQFSGIIVSQ
jgi:hypothetical protein